MNNEILKVILSAEEIDNICKRLGEQISKDYEGKKPLIVGLLKGCQPFMSDLIKHISIHMQLDYMLVSSYHGGTYSSGSVTIKKDIESNPKGRHIIIIDDIIDTGFTLKNITNLFKDKEAASVKVCCLLDKPEGRKVDITADYIGTTIPLEFVVGYGLDYDGYYRNLPYIGVLKPEVYTK